MYANTSEQSPSIIFLKQQQRRPSNDIIYSIFLTVLNVNPPDWINLQTFQMSIRAI